MSVLHVSVYEAFGMPYVLHTRTTAVFYMARRSYSCMRLLYLLCAGMTAFMINVVPHMCSELHAVCSTSASRAHLDPRGRKCV